MNFKLVSHYKPAGDQQGALEKLTDGIRCGRTHQTLLGVTGSGKTFTVANVIEKIQKPTLVIAHNKTLTAQLAQEYREFFPNNAVHYFVSYYDYYQPEAYMPTSDTYIEKEAQINAEIDRLRHASTQALLTRKDVIIVASVSCIYGLGNPTEYKKSFVYLARDEEGTREDLIKKLISIHFERVNGDLSAGTFRVVGDTLDIMPVHDEVIIRVQYFKRKVRTLQRIHAITRSIIDKNVRSYAFFPTKHFIASKDDREKALIRIRKELDTRVEQLKREEKPLEAERLRRRTLNDISLIREIGYCTGIENYSRYFDKRKEGDPPFTLLSYFPKTADGLPDFLTVIDESHVTIPQIAGMREGDRSRKRTLIEYGFRLPSAKDNRPLSFEEFNQKVGNLIYTSATPGKYEKEKSEKKGVVEQIIRPTGLVDPKVSIRPITGTIGQVDDVIEEIEKTTKNKNRSLVTTLTKKMAEELTDHLIERGIQARYIHSDIKTIERIEILTDFRRGKYDCIVGVNLLREGIDLPEVEFVAILDADKEGFLRSTTSLIQTIGRAARNVAGRVILYADTITGSIETALEETDRRRKIQLEYNEKHSITPASIKKNINDITDQIYTKHKNTLKRVLSIDTDEFRKNEAAFMKKKKREMEYAAKELDFETAALLRDEILELEALKKDTRGK